MAAAFVGGLIGHAIVDKLVGTVYSYLQHQMNWGASIEAALKKLHAALLPIQAALFEAEKVEMSMNRSPYLVDWIWKLRDAVEEAEDVIDEMEYYLLERQVLERDAAAAAAADASSSNKRKLKVPDLSSSKQMLKKIGKRALKMDPTLDKLNVVVDYLELINNNIHVFNDFVKQSAPLLGGNNIITRQTGPELIVDEVIGRRQDKGWVFKWLTQSDGHHSNISALNIWGIGGVGKTTLAQALFNDSFFQVKIWVCVSNNDIDMTEIMKKAIESANKCSPKTNIMSGLQEEVKKIVLSKKCLVVLDDVWDDQSNQNPQEWEKFIGLLLRHADKGSKILITSRIKSVAENILQLIPIQNEAFQLDCLQAQESLKLFNKHAFANANPDNYMNLQSVGKEIAKKCGGLPLALKMIAGMLSTKLDLTYWVSVLKSDILHLEHGTSKVMAVLKYSYLSLPSNLQSSFRMCSLFPQDYEYEEDELVALWMTAGCIIQDGNKLLEETGRDYLDILVTRSFFVGKGERRYVMHDLLHDLARDVSSGECLRVEADYISETLPKTLRHLFVVEPNTNLYKEISSLKKLRTLSINYKKEWRVSSHSTDDSFNELDDLLKHLNSLRALLFSNAPSMPNLNAIGNLIHLRLFHIDGYDDYFLAKPFKPLYKLYHLQNLKCQSCFSWVEMLNNRQKLSGSELDGVGNLIKLRHFNLSNIVFEWITQLRHLTELQELWFEMNEENALNFSDLKDLNMLREVTIINKREVGISIEDARLANVKAKKHLVSLSLHLDDLDPQLHEQVSDCLQPPLESNIEHLDLMYYKGIQSISWMNIDYLLNVTDIGLYNCPNLKHLPPLGELPCLQCLTLRNIPSLTQLGSHFFGSNHIRGFPSLKVLSIEKMDSLEEWTGADIAGWFPHLKELEIKSCQCKELPRLPLSLERLELVSVGLIVFPAWQDLSDSNNPSVEELIICECEELVECDQLSLSNCVLLKYLTIVHCPKLSSLYNSNRQNQATSISLDSLTIFNCNDLLANPQNATFLGFHVKNVKLDILLLLQIEPLRSIISVEELEVNTEEYYTDELTTSLPLQWFLQNRTSLSKLHLRCLYSLPSIPDDFKNHCSLTTLLIFDAPLLKSLPEMPLSLIELEIMCCPKLESLPEMPSSLTKLRIWEVPLLKSLPDMPSSLLELDVRDVPLLNSLPEMPFSLTELWIVNCSGLGSLTHKMPPQLTYLKIRSCLLLEERCKRDGPDWPKIAHVPNLHIG